MGAFIDEARKYMWQTYVGTNASDKGQCVGFFNKVVLDTTGSLYPIQGANVAKDILTANNTRTDLCVQVKNDPKNPNQLPSVGDWVIWGSTWGNGSGHISCVESVSVTAFTGIEQNYTANTVTRQQHNWTGVIGWIHFYANDPAPTPPPVVVPPVDPTVELKAQIAGLQLQLKDAQAANAVLQGENAELKKQVASLQAQLADEQAKSTTLQTQLDQANQEIKDLKAQLALAGSDTGLLNALGEILVKLIARLGLKK